MRRSVPLGCDQPAVGRGNGTCTSIQSKKMWMTNFSRHAGGTKLLRNTGKVRCVVLDSTSQLAHRPFGRVTHGGIGVLSKFVENWQKPLFPAVAHRNRDVA